MSAVVKPAGLLSVVSKSCCSGNSAQVSIVINTKCKAGEKVLALMMQNVLSKEYSMLLAYLASYPFLRKKYPAFAYVRPNELPGSAILTLV